MTDNDLKTRLQAELPALLQQDEAFRHWLEGLIRQTAVSQESFDARFERILQEFAEDRAEQRRKWDEQDRQWAEQGRQWEEQNRRWAEQGRQWEEQNRRWAEQGRQWEEQNRRWAEQGRQWEEQNRRWAEQDHGWKDQAHRWEEQDCKWEEHNRKWDEQNLRNKEMIAEIRAARLRHEQGIGALGARWGLASEQSFRAALKGILEQSFGVEVLNITEFDDEGLVFGVPDQVEIDVIIQNGQVILCELKASMSRSDMYTLDRKASYYAMRHQRPVARRLVISPMVHPTARTLADHLGIEVFTFVEDATGL